MTDVEQIVAWFETQAEKEQALLDSGHCNNPAGTQERWLVYKASAQSVRAGTWRTAAAENAVTEEITGKDVDVACPKCGRPPGAGCMFTNSGQDAPEGFVHNARAVAASDSARKKSNETPAAAPVTFAQVAEDWRSASGYGRASEPAPTPTSPAPSTIGRAAIMWKAIESYGRAFRLQDKLAADLDRLKARGDAVVMPTEMQSIAHQHDDACNDLVDAEIELLARAAITGGCRSGTRLSRASTASTQHLRMWNAINRMEMSAESVSQKVRRPLVTLSESVERASPGSLELRVEVKLLGYVVEHYTGHPDHVRTVAAIKAREVEGVVTELLKDRREKE